MVKVGNRFGYVDAAMRPITPAKFESVSAFVDGYAPPNWIANSAC